MGLSHSPSIVTEGLVLCLDAANTRSYPKSGTSWLDLSGNGNNGTLTNGPTFSSVNGGSIVFDGVNDYVTCGDISPFRLSSPDMTISVFFYYPGGNVNFPLCSKRYNASPYNQYNISMYNGSPYVGGAGNKVGVFIRPDNSNQDRYIYHTLSSSGIYCVTMTNDSNSLKLFVNGAFVGEDTTTQTNPTYIINGREYRIADSYSGNYYQGYVFNNFFYNRALTADEVRRNYLATKSRFGL